MSTNDCTQCAHVNQTLSGLKTVHECRRYPPQLTYLPTPTGAIGFGGYPTVSEKHWCGEFVFKLHLATN